MYGANLTIKTLQALGLLLKIIQWSIIFRSLLSWFPVSKNNILFAVLYRITEPILSPIRKLLAKTSFAENSVVDFSPIVALLILWVISGFFKFPWFF
ncbi:MAG: YggT family protein [Clostridium sp.]|nr:YggT family protein [Clostridium sp.]